MAVIGIRSYRIHRKPLPSIPVQSNPFQAKPMDSAAMRRFGMDGAPNLTGAIHWTPVNSHQRHRRFSRHKETIYPPCRYSKTPS